MPPKEIDISIPPELTDAKEFSLPELGHKIVNKNCVGAPCNPGPGGPPPRCAPIPPVGCKPAPCRRSGEL